MASAKKPTKAQAPEPAPIHGPIRAALEETIAALETDGRLGPTDAARVQICRSLASSLDAEPISPILWREYRAAEGALRKEAIAHGDPFDELLAHLSAQIRDEEKPKKAKPRP